MWLDKLSFRILVNVKASRVVWGGVLSILLLQSQLHASEAPKSISDVAVSTMAVHFQAHAKQVISSGAIRPISEQSLAFKVSGFVDRILVKEGQSVKKGQVLALLVLDEIDAQVAKASAVLDDAQRQLERITALKGRQLASDERGRKAQTSVQVAQSDLKIAQFNRKYAVIHAPANGRILTRHIEANELVQTGQKAFVFADETQGWSVRLSVADVDVVKLALGDVASVQLDAYPGQVFSGNVREIAGRSDARSQTFEVAILINQKLLKKVPRLYSGLIAHTQITPSQTQLLAPVPLTALIEANGQIGQVYVINKQGHAELRAIQLAYLSADSALVSSGLKEEEQVVVQGGPYIIDGAHIRIINNLPENLLQTTAK